MMNHTPGPWEQHPSNKTFIHAQSGELVAKALSPMGLPNRAEANARLIAAAPDLLEALEAVLEDVRTCGEVFGGDKQLVDFLLAAIAKATNA